MSLFQFSSASLDGIATAISIFIISAFLKISTDRDKSSPWLFYILLIAWILVASSRIQLFPLIMLVMSCAYFMRMPRYYFVSTLAALAVIGWQLVVLQTVVDGRVKLGASTATIVKWYLTNPLHFVDVMVATLSRTETWRSYLSSFFGMLGWLDTPFRGKEYIYLLIMITLIALCSFRLKLDSCRGKSQLILLSSAVISVITIYFALLVTWTPHPATVVNGVVGRYFLIPILMVAYALSEGNMSKDKIKNACGILLILIISIYSLINTVELLNERYY